MGSVNPQYAPTRHLFDVLIYVAAAIALIYLKREPDSCTLPSKFHQRVVDVNPLIVPFIGFLKEHDFKMAKSNYLQTSCSTCSKLARTYFSYKKQIVLHMFYVYDCYF